MGSGTGSERAELLPLLVEQVEMKDKERGIVRLVFETDLSALNFGTARGDCGITARLRDRNLPNYQIRTGFGYR
jgi:hypothetical protein